MSWKFPKHSTLEFGNFLATEPMESLEPKMCIVEKKLL